MKNMSPIFMMGWIWSKISEDSKNVTRKNLNAPAQGAFFCERIGENVWVDR